jgi:ankyrin repeat protein
MNRFLIPVAAIALFAPAMAQAQFSESFNFLKAVRDKDGEKVTEILNKPGSVMVNTRDPATGETALHIATMRRDAVWMNFMLAKGANPDMRDAKGNTALLDAAQLGWAEGVQILLTRRAGVDIANGSGTTPLIAAVQNRDLASVRLLLAAGANSTRPDNSAGLSARDYATRDPRAATILKEIQDAKPVARREISGPH